VDLFSLAERKLSDVDFVAFDTEATGYSNFSDRLIEVAGVRFGRRGGAWTTLGEFAELIRPDRPIPEETIAIHGITDDLVAGADTVAPVLDRFFAFARDAVLVVHYAPSDMGLMAFAYARAGRDVPAAYALDTFPLARKLFPGIVRYSLEDIALALSLPAPSHRAMPDAVATRALFEAGAMKLGVPEETPLGAVLEHTGPPLTLEEFSHISLLLPELLAPVAEAMAQARDLNIAYRGGTKKGVPRRVTPSHYFARQGHVFLEGFCHLSKEMKSFRVDRIESVSLIQEAAS
jgi:DNA polymerase III epsilon subunit family exonuclease